MINYNKKNNHGHRLFVVYSSLPLPLPLPLPLTSSLHKNETQFYFPGLHFHLLSKNLKDCYISLVYAYLVYPDLCNFP